MNSHRVVVVAVTAAAAVAGVVATPRVSARGSQQGEPLPNPTFFRIAAKQFPYRTDFLLDARVESNSRARHDGIVIYDGDWNALHRVTGWYEDALMRNGKSRPAVDILVSEFHTSKDAHLAYMAEVKSESYRPVKSRPGLGQESAEFSSSGILKQGKKQSRVEDSTIYVRYHNLELDVAVYDSHTPQNHWQAMYRHAALVLAKKLDAKAKAFLTPTATPTLTPAPTNTATPVATSTVPATPAVNAPSPPPSVAPGTPGSHGYPTLPPPPTVE